MKMIRYILPLVVGAVCATASMASHCNLSIFTETIEPPKGMKIQVT